MYNFSVYFSFFSIYPSARFFTCPKSNPSSDTIGIACKAASFGAWGHSRASGWGAPNTGHAWPVTAQGGFAAGEITSIACKACPEVVQYDCRVDCIHFCGQADLWKRSRCANTGGVFLFIPFYYSYSGCIANKASADCPRSSSPPWIPAQCGRFPAAGAARPQ